MENWIEKPFFTPWPPPTNYFVPQISFGMVCTYLIEIDFKYIPAESKLHKNIVYMQGKKKCGANNKDALGVQTFHCCQTLWHSCGGSMNRTLAALWLLYHYVADIRSSVVQRSSNITLPPLLPQYYSSPATLSNRRNNLIDGYVSSHSSRDINAHERWSYHRPVDL